jgi:hypothetical protein
MTEPSTGWQTCNPSLLMFPGPELGIIGIGLYEIAIRWTDNLDTGQVQVGPTISGVFDRDNESKAALRRGQSVVPAFHKTASSAKAAAPSVGRMRGYKVPARVWSLLRKGFPTGFSADSAKGCSG